MEILPRHMERFQFFATLQFFPIIIRISTNWNKIGITRKARSCRKHVHLLKLILSLNFEAMVTVLIAISKKKSLYCVTQNLTMICPYSCVHCCSFAKKQI